MKERETGQKQPRRGRGKKTVSFFVFLVKYSLVVCKYLEVQT
jgi:hypothetical protein